MVPKHSLSFQGMREADTVSLVQMRNSSIILPVTGMNSYGVQLGCTTQQATTLIFSLEQLRVLPNTLPSQMGPIHGVLSWDNKLLGAQVC